MQPIKHAVILAAGLGSRLGLDLPKCLVEVHGKKLIEYQLNLLSEIPNVYIVVGFKEKEVMEVAKKVRPDVIFVRNPHYKDTTNSYSTSLATEFVNAPFILMDGDTLMRQSCFKGFYEAACTFQENLVCVTKAQTEEAVFVELDQNDYCIKFETENRHDYEWSGLSFLEKNYFFKDVPGFVYKSFLDHLPIKGYKIDIFEIDTQNDLDFVLKNFKE